MDQCTSDAYSSGMQLAMPRPSYGSRRQAEQREDSRARQDGKGREVPYALETQLNVAMESKEPYSL
jgi:hypothetical protein